MAKKITTTVEDSIIQSLKDEGFNLHRGFYKTALENALKDMLEKKSDLSQLSKKIEELKLELKDTPSIEDVTKLKMQLDSLKNITNRYIIGGKHEN